MRPQDRTTARRTRADWPARVVVAAMLAVDAEVHGRLAQQRWDGWHLLTPAQLFGVEAIAAAGAGVALLAVNRRSVWAVAALVSLGGLVAVVLTRYVDIPAVGPIPSMYEPIWYAEKTWSAIAEGLGGIVAVAQFARLRSATAAADRPGGRGRLPIMSDRGR